ncbi:MAG: SUF system Fe-S cluster assembly regulator [Candidatus Puniceispirillaceae bacterium]
MLRLNRMTDYAILVLGVLHGRPDVLLSSAQIAQHAQLTQATAAKIIKALGSAGLVTTIRGTKGGCQLALPASAISIADVIEAIEGPIALTACVEGAEDPCSVQQGCFMSGSWNHINGAIRSALDGVSLSDLFSPSNMFPAPLETPETSSQTEV